MLEDQPVLLRFFLGGFLADRGLDVGRGLVFLGDLRRSGDLLARLVAGLWCFLHFVTFRRGERGLGRLDACHGHLTGNRLVNVCR